MHSIAIISLLAAATITTAAPTSSNTKQPRAWYVCANNGFRGECSVDPCAKPWCPDYKPWTYEPIVVANPPTTPPTTPKPKSWYVCASNKFRGECSADPCDMAWCPDYKYGTYQPISTAWKRNDPSICAPGTGYYQSCGNGFRGCCRSDACTGPSPHCPDTPIPNTPLEPAVVPPAKNPSTTPKPFTQHYKCSANGFIGECTVDPCANRDTWCPDYKYKTYEPVVNVAARAAAVADPWTCAPGTGYFQKCGNGFVGCCKGDACGNKWCPDYKAGTFEPVSSA